MKSSKPYPIKSISQFHELRGLPRPEHPLISVVNAREVSKLDAHTAFFVLDFYCILLKRTPGVSYKYGQGDYDFQDGVMFFIKPNQVIGFTVSPNAEVPSGWMLLIHPDFLWNTHLIKALEKYEFFDYTVNEALFLSQKEEAMLGSIIESIQGEYHSNIDKFSKQIIISHIECLLNYSERFYHRQFITREKVNHHLLDRLDKLLTDRLDSNNPVRQGLPTVQSICDDLNISMSYLSRVLKLLTGQSTQQFIQDKVIAKAKEKLSTTDRSVSEIAYELGFEHPQSFTRLFKTKTRLSPLAFRQSFN